MNITVTIDHLIVDLERKGMKAEYIIIGRKQCVNWMAQFSSETGFNLAAGRRFDFKSRGAVVVVCDSDILEVVPNAKQMLDGSFD